jgi:hypothetical protein
MGMFHLAAMRPTVEVGADSGRCFSGGASEFESGRDERQTQTFRDGRHGVARRPLPDVNVGAGCWGSMTGRRCGSLSDPASRRIVAVVSLAEYRSHGEIPAEAQVSTHIAQTSLPSIGSSSSDQTSRAGKRVHSMYTWQPQTAIQYRHRDDRKSLCHRHFQTLPSASNDVLTALSRRRQIRRGRALPIPRRSCEAAGQERQRVIGPELDFQRPLSTWMTL